MTRSAIDRPRAAGRARLPHRRRHRRRTPAGRAEDSLAELASLADTAGAEVVGAEWQNRRHVDPNWYLGKGQAEELVDAKPRDRLHAARRRRRAEPEPAAGARELLGVKVLDRSGLILDIFAQHARTHEGRLQVELAQLEYQLPRLTRLWTHLSRTQGGIGTRGPGETQLETDRRIIRDRIKKLKERVDARAPAARDGRRAPATAACADASRSWATRTRASPRCSTRSPGSEAARAEDRLFATLDPTSRQVKLGDGQSVVLTDTVGFIHKLPHQLVDAFRATLEEVNRADVLLEVVDGVRPARARAPPDRRRRCSTSSAPARSRASWPSTRPTSYDGAAPIGDAPAPVVGDAVPVSALTGFGLDTLRLRLSSAARRPLGGGRRHAAVQRGRAARARPGARHGRDRLPGHRTCGSWGGSCPASRASCAPPRSADGPPSRLPNDEPALDADTREP